MSEMPPRFDERQFLGRALSGPFAPFDVGGAVKASAKLIQDNWPLIFVLTIALMVAPKLLVLGVQLYVRDAEADSGELQASLIWINDFWDIVGYMIWSVVVGWAFVRRRSQKAITWRAFLDVVLPLFMLLFIYSAGIILGFVALIVPGFILMVAWSVASPVLITEAKSPMQALGRSRELCRGYFWPILGLLIVTLVADYLWEGLISILSFKIAESLPNEHVMAFFQAVTIPWGSIPTVVLTSALYFHLIALKEGGGEDAIAEVFD
jgi:hypothetical protein